MPEKSNSVKIGTTPCSYCDGESETFNKRGEAVCMTHYLVTDHGAHPKTASARPPVSMDERIDELSADHKVN